MSTLRIHKFTAPTKLTGSNPEADEEVQRIFAHQHTTQCNLTNPLLLSGDFRVKSSSASSDSKEETTPNPLIAHSAPEALTGNENNRMSPSLGNILRRKDAERKAARLKKEASANKEQDSVRTRFRTT
jgi:hypothetical protein